MEEREKSDSVETCTGYTKTATFSLYFIRNIEAMYII